MIKKVPAGAKGADVGILNEIRSRFAYTERFYRSGDCGLALEKLASLQRIMEGGNRKFTEKYGRLDREASILWNVILYSAEGRYQLRYREEMWDRTKKKEKEELAFRAWKKALEYAPKADLRLGIQPIVDACAGLIFLGKEGDGSATSYLCLGEEYVEKWFSDMFNAHSEAITAEDYEKYDDLLMQLKFHLALRAKKKGIDEGISALSRICGLMTMGEAEIPAEACYELGMLFARKADESKLPEQIVSNVVKSNLWLNLALECCGLESVARAKSARERIAKNERMRKVNFRNPLQISLVVKEMVEACRIQTKECSAGAFEALVPLRQNPTCTQAEQILIEAAMAEVCLTLDDYRSNALELWSRIKDSELLTSERKSELEEKFRSLDEKLKMKNSRMSRGDCETQSLIFLPGIC